MTTTAWRPTDSARCEVAETLERAWVKRLLDTGEYEARLEASLRATTHNALWALVRDLPFEDGAEQDEPSSGQVRHLTLFGLSYAGMWALVTALSWLSKPGIR